MDVIRKHLTCETMLDTVEAFLNTHPDFQVSHVSVISKDVEPVEDDFKLRWTGKIKVDDQVFNITIETDLTST